MKLKEALDTDMITIPEKQFEEIINKISELIKRHPPEIGSSGIVMQDRAPLLRLVGELQALQSIAKRNKV